MPYYLPIAGGRVIRFIPFPRVLVYCEVQSASSRIWTRVTVSFSNEDNHYTTGTLMYKLWTHLSYDWKLVICVQNQDEAYLGSSVESTEKDIDTRLTKAWTAINRLSIIWKSDLTDKMKRSFFQAAATSILLYGCTTWTLTKRLEKKLDGNYTRMLRAILNKSWRQHHTRHQLYGHLPPITKTIQVRRTRHAGDCWRSRDELIRDVLLWTPTHGRAKAGWPARTYIQQLCEDTGCCPENLPGAMNDREEWRERVRDIRSTSATWWRCPLCSRYRRRKWTQRYEFKSWTRLIAFHIAIIPLGKVWIQLFSLQLWVNSRTDWVLQPWWDN